MDNMDLREFIWFYERHTKTLKQIEEEEKQQAAANGYGSNFETESFI